MARPLSISMTLPLRENLAAALAYASQCQQEVVIVFRAKPYQFKIAPAAERERWEKNGRRTCYLVRPDGTVTAFGNCPPWKG